MRLNLRALDAFRAVLATGSASAAAQRLGVSQPSISRMLAKIQLDLGVDLFSREHGRLVPTAEARLLAEEVDFALSRIERLSTLARNITDLDIGQLHVVTLPSMVDGPLADIIAGFLDRYPNLKLVLDPRDGDSLIERIATKVADCGIGKLPVQHKDIRVEPLITTGTVCVIPLGHPLLAKEWIGPADLKNERLILLGKGRGLRVAIEASFSKARIVPNVRLETHTVASACAFATRGTGIAIVNEMMAKACAGPNVALRPFRPRLIHEYGFLTAAVTPMARTTEAFLQACKAHFSQ